MHDLGEGSSVDVQASEPGHPPAGRVGVADPTLTVEHGDDVRGRLEHRLETGDVCRVGVLGRLGRERDERGRTVVVHSDGEALVAKQHAARRQLDHDRAHLAGREIVDRIFHDQRTLETGVEILVVEARCKGIGHRLPGPLVRPAQRTVAQHHGGDPVVGQQGRDCHRFSSELRFPGAG